MRGSSSRSGPAPDPNALRRDRDSGEWLKLPAAGRDGDPPVWPLAVKLEREAELWVQLWQKPQAIAWEHLGQHLEVALFVRRFVEAEELESKVNLSTLVRQMSDSLGLTTPGLRANRWQIVQDVEPVARTSSRPSSRSRLKVVDDRDAS